MFEDSPEAQTQHNPHTDRDSRVMSFIQAFQDQDAVWLAQQIYARFQPVTEVGVERWLRMWVAQK